MQALENRRKIEQRYFNYQKQGHLVQKCKETIVYGNYAQTKHYQKCFNLTPKYPKYQKNNYAKDNKSSTKTSNL